MGVGLEAGAGLGFAGVFLPGEVPLTVIKSGKKTHVNLYRTQMNFCVLTTTESRADLVPVKCI